MLVLASVLVGPVGRQDASLRRQARLDWHLHGPAERRHLRVPVRRRTGLLSLPGLAAETPSPSFLALHRDGKVLFAVNECTTGRATPGR